ncbi:MFS transporter [Streptomyces nodosus]|uniref:MFS transporter n=1 Tax=Streptomyces nodosus TaxID=40318 RepID=UPI0036E9F4DA
MAPPLGDIAHIGHVQLFTPEPDATVAFFTDYLGLTVNGRHGDTVYLRTFDDYEHHSLAVTARDRPGLGRLALRTSGEEALHRRVRAIEEAGGTGRWVEDEPGIGRLYVTTDPDGHEHALYWESEHYRAPDALRPALKNQPQAKPDRGVGVRRLDHINFLTFVVLFNLGGIVGMLIAGRASDRFGAPRISAIWFALTAAGVFLLSVRMPLGVTFLVVFLTGVFLNSAQTMIYATVSIGSTPANRATAVGWTSGMGRFGAVFGPWLGGRLLATHHGDWGFTAFALAGVSSMVFIGLAALRSSRRGGVRLSPTPAVPFPRG